MHQRERSRDSYAPRRRDAGHDSWRPGSSAARDADSYRPTPHDKLPLPYDDEEQPGRRRDETVARDRHGDILEQDRDRDYHSRYVTRDRNFNDGDESIHRRSPSPRKVRETHGQFDDDRDDRRHYRPNYHDSREGPRRPLDEPQRVNTGESDVAHDQTPSLFLLVRGLDPSVTEHNLAQAMERLCASKDKGPPLSKPDGARSGSLHRVFIVRNRRKHDSWGFGLAEFFTVEDAKAALKKYCSMTPFSVVTKPVTLGFVHSGVFTPYIGEPSLSTAKFSFPTAANQAVRLSYWDPRGYASEHVVNEQPPPAEQAAAPNGKAPDSEKTNREKRGKKRKADEDTNQKNAKKTAMPSHLQTWTNRYAELRGVDPGPKAPPRMNDSLVAAPAAASSSGLPGSGVKDARQPPSFGSTKDQTCLLCMRKFKNPAELQNHERISDLHKKNMTDSTARAKAAQKLEDSGVHFDKDALLNYDPGKRDKLREEPRYRDRAQERRQTDQLMTTHEEDASAERAKFSLNITYSNSAKPAGGRASPSPPPAQNKGAALLSKMGYNGLSGLGATGNEGRTAPIETNLYAAGVGLGAEGGKVGDAIEVAGASSCGDERAGYNAWKDRGRERAVERLKRME